MNIACVLLSVLLVGSGIAEASAQTPAETPAPSAVPAASDAPAPAPPAARELIYQGEATSILGRQVHDPQGRTVGRIVDVLVDDLGQPRAAIIDFGGFMGIGNRRIAVAWRALRFAPAVDEGTITLDMTQEQIKETPEYRRRGDPADPPVAVAAPPSTDAPGPALPQDAAPKSLQDAPPKSP